jgi:hypothetical protein
MCRYSLPEIILWWTSLIPMIKIVFVIWLNWENTNNWTLAESLIGNTLNADSLLLKTVGFLYMGGRVTGRGGRSGGGEIKSLLLMTLECWASNKISPQPVSNLTEILPEPLSSVGKIWSVYKYYWCWVLVACTLFRSPQAQGKQNSLCITTSLEWCNQSRVLLRRRLLHSVS